jgi:hypothetical protein
LKEGEKFRSLMSPFCVARIASEGDGAAWLDDRKHFLDAEKGCRSEGMQCFVAGWEVAEVVDGKFNGMGAKFIGKKGMVFQEK